MRAIAKPRHPIIALVSIWLVLGISAAVGQQQRGTVGTGPPSPAAAKSLSADAGSLANAEQLEKEAAGLAAKARFSEALPLYEQALAIREKQQSESPGVAATLREIGFILLRQSHYAAAEERLRRALAIDEKQPASDSTATADDLIRLGNALRFEGRIEESEPLLQRGLASAEKAAGSNSPVVANALNALALVDMTRSRYAEAEAMVRRAQAIQEKALGPDRPDVAFSLDNLTKIYLNQGRYPEAEATEQRALAIREKTLGSDNDQTAWTLEILSRIHYAQDRFTDAEAGLRQALAINQKIFGPDSVAVASELGLMGELFRREGRFKDAEVEQSRAVEIIEKALGPDSPILADSIENLGLVYDNERRLAEAEVELRRALSLYEKAFGRDHPAVANGLTNLANVLRKLARFGEAETLLKRALAIREKALGPEHPRVAWTLQGLGLLYQAQHRQEDAEAAFRRAASIDEKALGPTNLEFGFRLGNLGMVLLDEGKAAEALTELRRATAILRARSAINNSIDQSGTLSEQKNLRAYYIAHLFALWQTRRGDTHEPSDLAEAFEVTQLATASSTASAVARMGARFASGSDALAKLARQREDAVERWQHLDRDLLLGTGDGESGPGSEAVRRAEVAEQAKLETLIGSLDAELASRFPDYAELANPQPVTIPAVQSLLSGDEAMLVFTLANKGSYVWVIRPARVTQMRVPYGAANIAKSVRQLRRSLDPSNDRLLVPFDVDEAYALYQKILAPSEASFAGAHHLIVVLDGALQSLPLGLLVTKPPAPSNGVTDYRAVSWLARQYAVTVLPSVSSLKALRAFTARAHATDPFVGIGNPTLHGSPGGARGVSFANLFRGSTVDVAALRELPALPDTEPELRTIAATLGAGADSLFLGNRATEPAVRAASLDRYRVVVFATHGLVAGDIEGLAEPALVLTPPAHPTPDDDGLLTSSKVAKLRLNADWVVLSACNTAASDGTPGADGLSGLAKGFFFAGSRALLVSHWPVVSEAAARLTTGTFAALAADPSIGRAEALRRAEMAFLDDPTIDARLKHPLVWAPFIVVGEGGQRR